MIFSYRMPINLIKASIKVKICSAVCWFSSTVCILYCMFSLSLSPPGPRHWSHCSHSTCVTYLYLFQCTAQIKNCKSPVSTYFRFSLYVPNKWSFLLSTNCLWHWFGLNSWLWIFLITHSTLSRCLTVLIRRSYLESVFLGWYAISSQSTMSFPLIHNSMVTWPALTWRRMSWVRLPGSLFHTQVRFCKLLTEVFFFPVEIKT